MNRETKRMLQRQGQVGPDGEPARPKASPRPAPRPVSQRTSPAAFVRDVRSELRKVAWPTRPEVINYSIVVLIALIVLTILIFILDYAFAKAVLFVFEG